MVKNSLIFTIWSFPGSFQVVHGFQEKKEHTHSECQNAWQPFLFCWGLLQCRKRFPSRRGFWLVHAVFIGPPIATVLATMTTWSMPVLCRYILLKMLILSDEDIETVLNGLTTIL